MSSTRSHEEDEGETSAVITTKHAEFSMKVLRYVFDDAIAKNMRVSTWCSKAPRSLLNETAGPGVVVVSSFFAMF